MLSIPNTSSKTVSVSRLTQAEGSERSATTGPPSRDSSPSVAGTAGLQNFSLDGLDRPRSPGYSGSHLVQDRAGERQVKRGARRGQGWQGRVASPWMVAVYRSTTEA